MSLFNKGDRVRIVNSPVYPNLLGREGTIVEIYLAKSPSIYVGVMLNGLPTNIFQFAERDVELLSCELNAKTRLNRIFGNPFSIKKVIFNPPATIILWTDGTKTVVKAKNEDFDPEKGLAMAISKKALGNEGNYYNIFKKWLPKDNFETLRMLAESLLDCMIASLRRISKEAKSDAREEM